MSKLYACIISNASQNALVAIAEAFAYRIEKLDDGILFDITGLENLLGDPSVIAQKIADALDKNSIEGNIAISTNARSAITYARSRNGISIVSESELETLGLSSLDIDPDTLNVFNALGFRNVSDLKQIPYNELVSRYGTQFRDVLDVAINKGKHILTPNLKEYKTSWSYDLDFPVSDFEQLIFILRHGLERVFVSASEYGFKTEQIDISLSLDKKAQKSYEIKVSFPSTDIKFWLKVLELRVSTNPPESAIKAIDLTCHFAKPRTAQKGLFTATKPEPESLLLTVNKIKKLLGEKNVGVPVLLDKRQPKAFTLDTEKLPVGKEVFGNGNKGIGGSGDYISDKNPNSLNHLTTLSPGSTTSNHLTTSSPCLALSHFDPPLPADVIINQKRLMYIRTAVFAGEVKEYSGVWKGSSSWWNPFSWKTEEWDVEINGGGIYRIARTKDGWFVTGEYD